MQGSENGRVVTIGYINAWMHSLNKFFKPEIVNRYDLWVLRHKIGAFSIQSCRSCYARHYVNATGTCFIQKIYAPSSSLLQGKHLPFTTSPLHLNICCLFVILSLTNYIVTLPRYFSFRLPHLNINTGPPSGEMDKNIQRKSHFLFFSH